MAFLDLCEIKNSNREQIEGFPTGRLLIKNYSMSYLRKNEALLIEGIHQFSSLVAESVFGKHPDSVFIPVMIKNMDINNPMNLEKVVLKGEMISSGEFIHVRTTQIVSDQISGRADFFLKKIQLTNDNASVDKLSYGSDLFNIVEVEKLKDRLLIRFKINEFHHILKNHFSGYPVCPASLIIEFISDILLNYGFNAHFQVHNAKFLNPLQPCNEYELEMQLSESAVSFIITGPEQIRLTAGKLIYQ
ncbi:hypothetical protein GCM10027361_25140 [Erwinia aphidicola]|uniref:hypothetical protein n=1 Tax=Erwinia aphidicola TaxID=68334 RepID=UPI0017470F27|nr:hypothetical protein [Erwinia aphidicola]MBD1378284.1 hypothetical protein [Erwinia aphidicola]